MNNIIIEFFVRLFHVSVIAAVIIYVVKRFVLPSLRDAVIQKKQHLLTLQDSLIDQEQILGRLVEEMRVQEQEISQLNQKINLWRQASAMQETAQHEIMHQRVHEITQKRALQSESVSRYYIEKKVLKSVFYDVERNLSSLDEEAKKAYLHQAITLCKERR